MRKCCVQCLSWCFIDYDYAVLSVSYFMHPLPNPKNQFMHVRLVLQNNVPTPPIDLSFPTVSRVNEEKKIHLVIGVLEMVGCCCIACYLTWHLHVQIKQECWCGRSLGEWDLATHVFLTKRSRKPQQVSRNRPCWFSSFVSAWRLWASGDTQMWMLAMCFY
jgi:hypothetical protein